MPAQDRLRRHDAREPFEHSTTERDAAHREPDPVGIRQSEAAPTQLALQDPVLFLKVLEHALLVAIEPAGEDDGEDLEDGGHGARERSYAGGTASVGN